MLDFYTINSLSLMVISGLIFFYDKIDKKRIFFDNPDGSRKIHKKSIPAIGGFLIVFHVVVNLLFFKNMFEFSNKFISVITFLVCYFLTIGLLDDRKNLSPISKIILIFAVLLIFIPLDENLVLENLAFKDIAYIIKLNEGSLIFTILAIFFLYNFLNFSDGSNGVTLSITIYWISLLLLYKSFYLLFLVSILMLLLVLFFFNVINKIFLGNNGVNVLSILLSLLFIISYNTQGIFKVDEILLIMLIPAIDALRVTIERILKNKSPLLPDRNHFHHLLEKKIKQNFVFIPYILFTVFPFFISFFVKTYYSFFISVLFYTLTIYKLKKIIKS